MSTTKLVDFGRRLVFGLKDKILAVGIEHVISSPMIRAKRTAEMELSIYNPNGTSS